MSQEGNGYLRDAGARGSPLAGPLGRRLLGWFLLFSLLPLMGSNLLGYFVSQDIIVRLAERSLGAIAGAEAQHIEDQVGRALADLQVVAAGNEFLAAGAIRLMGGSAGRMGEVADPVAVERHLRRKRAELRALDILFLQRPDGSVAASTGRVVPEAVRRAPPGAGPVFERLPEPDARGASRFLLSVPVEGPEGEAVGYLAGLLGPEGLRELLGIPPLLGGAVESFVVEEGGRLVLASRPDARVDYRAPVAASLLESGPGAFLRYHDPEGVEVIGTAAAVGRLPWFYVAEYPVADALGPLRLLRRLFLLFAGLLGAGLVGAAWFVTGDIVAPVRRLRAAARRVARGDLEVSVPVEREDEIGELGRAFNDMTRELAEAAERLQELHRREMERAQQMATVGELASGVAHEIKNPLMGLSGGFDLVEEHAGSEAPLVPVLDEMRRQLARIDAAVRDLLAFARPAAPSLTPASLNDVVERCVRLLQPAAHEAGVELAFRPASHLPLVPADGDLIGQALMNLALNAVQAASRGERVTISTGVAGGAAFLDVRDSGRGIPPEEMGRIFKPFFTTRHRGTGLGLPIARAIVERHGGRIEVDSGPGEGSSFRILLPLDSPGEGAGR